MAHSQESSNADAAAPVANWLRTTTALYVADLDCNVTDSQLYDLFNQIGQVVSVRIIKDWDTQQSLGYGYVNFSHADHAAKALKELNFTPLNNKTIRIMYSNRDPFIRRSGHANIFVKNLDMTIDSKALYDTFSAFGNILSCKIATDDSGQSKGHGYVQFEKQESAQNAIDKLNGTVINDKQVYVGHFQSKKDRENALNSAKFTNVYVKNLSESTTENDLMNIFGEYGTITSAVVKRNEDGTSKCFGFVNFENADAAAKAVEELDGKTFGDKEWYVGRAKKKSERELELKEHMKEAVDKYQGSNLYMKNLDDIIGDEELRELFSGFGTITSCKVMRDTHGVSRGSGFVAFSTPEEANRALDEMNGKMVAGKPLYVAPAQKKEERRAVLQALFSQMRPVTMAPSPAPPMPPYHPGAPGIRQQFFYGQAPPAIIPQAGFGYQQQHFPGTRPGGAPLPNFFVPLVQQGQQGQRPGGRWGAGPMQQLPQPVPLMQQQMLPRGHVHRYPPGQNTGGQPIWDAGGVPIQAHPPGRNRADQPTWGAVPIHAVASALANASPEQQKTMLGEVLYPLVYKLEHTAAAKVTGMILQMDQSEVLHLIESPDALKAKVAEAMNVLANVAQQQSTNPADQLASLSLSD